jgi:hypothetical protein
MQELFLAVSRSIDCWDPSKERGSFRGWLRRVTRCKRCWTCCPLWRDRRVPSSTASCAGPGLRTRLLPGRKALCHCRTSRRGRQIRRASPVGRRDGENHKDLPGPNDAGKLPRLLPRRQHVGHRRPGPRHRAPMAHCKSAQLAAQSWPRALARATARFWPHAKTLLTL